MYIVLLKSVCTEDCGLTNLHIPRHEGAVLLKVLIRLQWCGGASPTGLKADHLPLRFAAQGAQPTAKPIQEP